MQLSSVLVTFLNLALYNYTATFPFNARRSRVCTYHPAQIWYCPGPVRKHEVYIIIRFYCRYCHLRSPERLAASLQTEIPPVYADHCTDYGTNFISKVYLTSPEPQNFHNLYILLIVKDASTTVIFATFQFWWYPYPSINMERYQ